MSRAGWELVEYSWYLYYFRRMESPQEYEYRFERRLGPRWLLDVQEAYLSQRKHEGWEFFKYFNGWHYFRRPVAAAAQAPSAEAAAETLDHVRRYLNMGATGACLGLFGFLAGLWLRYDLPRFGRLAIRFGRMLYLFAGFLVGSGSAIFVLSFLVLILAFVERRRLQSQVWAARGSGNG